jgi:hypothetical protein
MLRHEERDVFFDALAALMIVPEGMGHHARPPSDFKTGVTLFTAKLELSGAKRSAHLPSCAPGWITGQQCEWRECLPQDGTDSLI